MLNFVVKGGTLDRHTGFVVAHIAQRNLYVCAFLFLSVGLLVISRVFAAFGHSEAELNRA